LQEVVRHPRRLRTEHFVGTVVIDIAQIQKAKSRARARHKVNVQKPRIRVMAGVAYTQDRAPETAPAFEPRAPLQLIVDNPLPLAFVALEDADAPFDPPDVDDILGFNEEDEGADTFVLEEPNEEPAPPDVEEPELDFSSQAREPAPAAIAHPLDDEPELDFEPAPTESFEALDLEAEHAMDAAPFDPPELEAPLQLSAPDLPSIELTPIDPPGDASAMQPAPENRGATTPEPEAPRPAPQIPAPPRRAFALNVDQTLYEQPVPPITIHASWDRPEMGALLEDFVADRRMHRASISTGRGGLDAAIHWLQSNPSPDLLILDSDLRAPEILAGLARLADVIEHGAKIIFVGAVNDIGLMRELAACGIKYVVPPIREDDLARCVCGMYAEATTSRVIAVMGARGGIGASTIAHNLAWSIAERQTLTATLVDLDLSFGAAAFNARLDAPRTIADLRETPYEQVALMQTTRLQVLAAPTQLAHAFDLEVEDVQTLIYQARRSSAYVVLDLPHAWNSRVQQALALADDVVLVVGPDLASLRNADHLVKAIGRIRPGKDAPLVALSMTGVRKRPEIPLKDFTSALGIAPLASFPYDPALYGAAAIKGSMLGETAPRSKAALTIDAFATAITGHEPVVREKNVKSILRDAPSPVGPDLETPFDLGRPASEEYLMRARDAAHAALDAPQRAGSFAPKPRTNKLRAAAYVLALLIVGAAWVVRDTRDASAEPSQPAHIAAPRPADPASLYRDAVQMLAANPSAGLAALRTLAERGYAPAEYRLAKAYERGDGVAADLPLARQWTERAAEAGHARAMHDLGVYYAQGEGAAQNDALAFRWFRQAADFNIADSQFNLGVLYQSGRGVTASNAEALFWFALAASHGDQAAAARAAELETALPEEEVAAARARAAAFTPRTPAAAANYEPAPNPGPAPATPAETSAGVAPE
jgi:pilus assembly protein CpaE